MLERNQMIYVTAAHSGNSASVVGRREVLALLAAGTMMARYPVNPMRVYVGGFSGGSRVAMRLAVAHPEVFHGALLNAGSDPIGDADFPLPAPEIFARVQESSRIVYLSGKNDSVNTEKDAQSAASLHRRCVFDTYTEVIPWTGHEVAGPSAFERALDALSKHVPPDPQKWRACRDRQ
jgi:poly(3-hydroxybutyrate) depolymerase